MNQYLLTVCYPPDSTVPDPSRLQKIMKDVGEVRREMQTAGVWVFAGGLHPASSATVVRVKDHEVLMTDGPFTEGKEHIGGITVIQAADLDAALHWARKLSAATTTAIEVWPFRQDAPK
jgi:hypothetical protein